MTNLSEIIAELDDEITDKLLDVIHPYLPFDAVVALVAVLSTVVHENGGTPPQATPEETCRAVMALLGFKRKGTQ